MIRAFALLLALLLAVPAAAQTPEEQSRLDWVARRGRLLFDLDRAAWVGTDDMLARIRDPAGQGIGGYIVERDGDAQNVIFFGGPQDAPVAFYRGRVENHLVASREIFAPDARPALTPVQRRLAAVRSMAGRLGRRPCGDAAFNTVVIPPETADGPIDLYLLTPQVRNDEYPLGGHFRFTIAIDGAVQSSREFTRTCIALRADRTGARGRPEGLFVTHLLDRIPTEIHVFSAIAAGLPLYVATSEPQRVWAVEGGRIRLVEPPRN